MFIIYDRKHLVINRYTQGIMYVKNNSSYDINYIYMYMHMFPRPVARGRVHVELPKGRRVAKFVLEELL